MRQILWLISFLSGLMWLGGTFAAGLPDFTTVVTRVAPVVVNVRAIQQPDALATGDSPAASEPGDDASGPDWYRRFFGTVPSPGGNGDDDGNADKPDSGDVALGSGFIISSDGEILTNYHVIKNAQSITVKLDDRRVLAARLVGADPASDLALLKINIKGLPVAAISNTPVQVGQWVLAIGAPFGFDHSVTAGIVSAEGRSIGGEQYVPYIQTDVPINPGNSGGPLFNLQGQVVGINSEIYSRSGGYQGVSFAIPIKLAMQVAAQLRQQGHVTRGWLGIGIEDVQPENAGLLRLSRPEGALVSKVMADSPAARAGLRVGDVILAYNGTPVMSSEALPPLVGSTAVGRTVPLTVLRNGRRTTLRVLIGTLPTQLGSGRTPRIEEQTSNFDSLGLAVRSLTAAERRQFKLAAGGVVVERVAEGPAQRAGFKLGDVVVMLNGRLVTDPQQFLHLEQQLPATHPVPALVKRADGSLFLPLELGGT